MASEPASEPLLRCYWASRPLWLLTSFSVSSSPPSLFTVIALALRAASPAICFSDCLWGGVRQRPTADNGQRRLPKSVLALGVNASAILRLGLPSTCALHVRPPQRVGVRSQGSIGRAPLYPVGVRGARYHGQGSWAGECGSPGSLGKGELGSWSERAHNPIAQETAIPIQCRAASQ